MRRGVPVSRDGRPSRSAMHLADSGYYGCGRDAHAHMASPAKSLMQIVTSITNIDSEN